MVAHTHTHTHTHTQRTHTTDTNENAELQVFPTCTSPSTSSTAQNPYNIISQVNTVVGVTVGSATAAVCFISLS